VDEMHAATSPVLLGVGESLFAGIELLQLGNQCAEQVTSPLRKFSESEVSLLTTSEILA
jgi:hypothetical protein